MSSEQEKTIVENEVYNVIRAIASKLEGLAAYNKYQRDASEGAPWQQLRQQDEQAVKQLMGQLETFAKAGRLRVQ